MKTLKEKFEDIIISVYSDFGDFDWNMESKDIDECVDIAEEFANSLIIGFANWLSINCDKSFTRVGCWMYKGKIETSHYLLEIYKREKELC